MELDAIAGLLENRGDEEAVAFGRRAMHLRNIDDIRRVRNRLVRTDEHAPRNGSAGALNGELVHRVTLATVTRLAEHPWALAMSTLLHHDQGGEGTRQNNFDLLLVETGPEQPSANAVKVQVKAACGGWCDEPQSVQIDRAKYAPDITFVSGCCDFGIRGGRHDASRYAVPNLLMREADDAATTSDVLTLDNYTGRLLLSLTMDDPRRMGLFVPELAEDRNSLAPAAA
jgi:hypothetical protein